MSERLVLCTGGTGYVGGVVAPLIAQKHRVRAFDSMLFGDVGSFDNIESVKGDIRDLMAVRAAMDGVTDVIHMAGIVTDHLVDLNPRKAFTVNIEGTRNITDAARRAGVQRFTYISSSSVYGWAAERFEIVDEWVTPRPKTAYAMQKYAGEQIVRDAFLAGGVYTIVRPATMCGPAPRMRLDVVVNVFAKQAYFDNRLTVHGGSQYRSNIHVRDAAEVLAMLVDAPPEKVNGAVFNLTWGNMTVGDIAEMVAAVYRERYEKPVLVEYQNVADPRSYRLKARELAEVFGWQPKRTMRDAVNDLFDLFDTGAIDPTDIMYWNDRRLADLMRQDVLHVP